MSTIQLSQSFSGQPSDVFDAACRAVADLGQYKVTSVHAEIASAVWSWSGPPHLVLEVQVWPQSDGSQLKLELRDSDLRDRIGLRRREARRVLAHIAAHVEALASGLQVIEPAPAPLTDRQVIGGLLAGAMGLAVLGVLFQCAMGLFRST